MKAKVFDLEGKILKEIELPQFFEETYRPDLIKRAVISSQSRSYQPKGNSPYSNRKNTAEYRGLRKGNRMNQSINTGHARLPRLKNRRTLMAGRVASVSQAVGGPRAHPPKITKILLKKINSKERTKAIISAIATTANNKIVEARGNIIPPSLTLPIIIDRSIEDLEKTSNVYDFIKKVGLEENIEKAKASKTYRAGKGKMRGRRYKRRKSLLFVLDDNKNYRAFLNLEGVDVISARQLSIQDLAPGTHPGRLTIFSESAIKKLEERFNR